MMKKIVIYLKGRLSFITEYGASRRSWKTNDQVLEDHTEGFGACKTHVCKNTRTEFMRAKINISEESTDGIL